MSPSTACLDALPVELLHELSEHLHPDDLFAWRLVCKQFNICSTKAFGKEHIVNRRHALSTSSLQSLLEIAAHPVWGPFVRSVEVSAGCLQEMGLGMLKKLASQELKGREELPPDEKKLWDQRVALYSDMLSDQNDLISGGAFTLLKQAFSDLRKHGITEIDVGIADNLFFNGFGSLAWKPHTPDSIHDIQEFLILRDLSVCVTQLLLFAALEARVKVAKLTVLELGILHGFDFTLVPRTALRNIRALDIKVFEKFRDHLPPRTIVSLTILFSEACNLEALHLHQKKGNTPISAVFPPMMEGWKGHPLREIVLDGLVAKGTDLVRWLDRCKSTLQILHIGDLELEDVCATSQQAWVPVLKWMLEDSSLESLHLNGNLPVASDRKGTYSVVLDGRDAITDGLRELLVLASSEDGAAKEAENTPERTDLIVDHLMPAQQSFSIPAEHLNPH